MTMPQRSAATRAGRTRRRKATRPAASSNTISTATTTGAGTSTPTTAAAITASRRADSSARFRQWGHQVFGRMRVRVWAPNATSVAWPAASTVERDREPARPLTQRRHVVGRRGRRHYGAEYQYVINGTLWRIDPWSTRVTNSSVTASSMTAPIRWLVQPPAGTTWSSTRCTWHFSTTARAIGHLAIAINKLNHVQALGRMSSKSCRRGIRRRFLLGLQPAHPSRREHLRHAGRHEGLHR